MNAQMSIQEARHNKTKTNKTNPHKSEKRWCFGNAAIVTPPHTNKNTRAWYCAHQTQNNHSQNTPNNDIWDCYLTKYKLKKKKKKQKKKKSHPNTWNETTWVIPPHPKTDTNVHPTTKKHAVSRPAEQEREQCTSNLNKKDTCYQKNRTARHRHEKKYSKPHSQLTPTEKYYQWWRSKSHCTTNDNNWVVTLQPYSLITNASAQRQQQNGVLQTTRTGQPTTANGNATGATPPLEILPKMVLLIPHHHWKHRHFQWYQDQCWLEATLTLSPQTSKKRHHVHTPHATTAPTKRTGNNTTMDANNSTPTWMVILETTLTVHTTAGGTVKKSVRNANGTQKMSGNTQDK